MVIGALAGIAFSMATASAATVGTPVNNDLFVAFRATDGTGATTSYIVKLGAYSTVTASSNSNLNTTLNLGNIAADLSATYGSDWATSENVTWSVFGIGASGSNTIYGSKQQTAIGVPSQDWTALDGTERSSTRTSISNVINGIGGYAGSNSTSNSLVGVLQANSNSVTSYAYQVGTGATDFGSLSGWSSIEAQSATGIANTGLDLYRIDGNGVTTRGYFTINNSGIIGFNAVPEPTSALLGLVGAGVLLARRSRKTASV